MADKKASEKAAKGFENLAPLFGLAASVAGQVPGLKKPRKRGSEAAARNASMRSAGAAVGASQTGFGASRGLALRSGLRAAAKHARAGAVGAAQGEAADQASYDAEMTSRNARLAQFGKDMGEMAGMVGVGVVESRQAKAAEAEAGQLAEQQALQAQAASLMPTYAEEMGVDPATGLDPQQQGAAPQQLTEEPIGPGPTLDQTDQYGDSQFDPMADVLAPPTLEQMSLDPALAELGVQNKETLYSIAPELELQHRLENLALDEAYRTGTNINRIYARLRRIQNQPAIAASIEGMQLQMPELGGQ
jgi:hypothetical protein